jgi:hypothetical protein
MGTLSFRKIGESSFPTPTGYANVTINGLDYSKRFIALYQKRRLSDALFSRLRDFSDKRAMWFVGVFSADRREQSTYDKLVGRVHIYPSRSHWEAATVALPPHEKGDTQGSLIKRLIHKIRDTSIDRDERAEAFRNLEKFCAASALFSIDVELRRDGVLSLSAPSSLSGPHLERSRQYAADRGHDFDEWIANQTYCFLRDVSHNHQHHHGSADTLISVQKYDEKNPKAWKVRIVYSLQHFIIDSKRRMDLPSLVHCKGIMAYRDSFVEISQLSGEPTITSSAHLVASVSAQIESAAKGSEAKARIASVTQAMLGWLAVVLALIALFLDKQISNIREAGQGTDLVNWIASLLHQHLSLSSLLTLALLPLAGLYFRFLLASWRFDNKRNGRLLMFQAIGRDLLILLNYESHEKTRGFRRLYLLAPAIIVVGAFLIYRAIIVLLSL